MSGFDFEYGEATQEQAKVKMALHGPSGSGKTFSSLAIGTALGENVFCLDTEFGSSKKYASRFKFNALKRPLPDFHPEKLISFLETMPAKGFDVLIVDSLTHFWKGKGGFLDLVEDENRKLIARGKRPDSFGAWRMVTPLYERLVYAIHACQAHVIICMRAKEDYERGDDGKVRKLGLSPEIREGFLFEVDIEGAMTIDHDLVIGKTRCENLDGKVFRKPGVDVAKILLDWVGDGVPAAPLPQKPAAAATTEPEWLSDLLDAFTNAADESELKAAQAKAQAHRSEIVGSIRERVMAASAEAKKRIEAQAAQ